MTEDDSSKEYSVNWKNHMIHIRKAFDNLFTTSQLVDVTLCCDGKKIGAHRMLLSACSNYFREIFKDIPPYQHPVIILNGVEFSVLNDILKFIYNGEVSVDINKLDSFLKTAQMLKISGLTDQNDNERVGENNNNIPPVEPEQVETPRETQQSQQINVQQPQPQEQDISDNLTELISAATASTSKEQPRKSVKRQSEEDPSQRAEKICKPEADNEYLGDIKCEPGDMMTFEESLEDDPLNSEAYQQNDDDDDEDKDFPTTSGMRQPGDDEFKQSLEVAAEEQNAVTSHDCLPEKSRERYEQVYKEFREWCSRKRFRIYTENVLMLYFTEKAKTFKPPSLWCHYSMLKATMKVNNTGDISKYKTLLAYLKRMNVGYQPKKSEVLTRQHINQFLIEAPDEIYLMIKVATIIGVTGALRTDELKKLSVENVQDLGSTIAVSVNDSRNNVNKVFTLPSHGGTSLDYAGICRKYIALRPPNTEHSRFFIYYKNYKCSRQPVGIHTIGRMPERIASFLKLPNPSSYSGHCFRRSSLKSELCTCLRYEI